MFVNEVEASSFPASILDKAEQQKYEEEVKELYKYVSKVLMLSRIRPGSKTFDKIINFLTVNAPYIQAIKGIRPSGSVNEQRIVRLEESAYPPEAIAFFRQVFGEDDWDNMSEEDQKKQIVKLAKRLKDGTLKLAAGPGGLRTRKASADLSKIEKVLKKYKAEKETYFKKMMVQLREIAFSQLDGRGYDYMIKQNPNLQFRTKAPEAPEDQQGVESFIKGMLKKDAMFKQDRLKNRLDYLIGSIEDRMVKIKLSEHFEFVFDLDVLKEQKELLNEGFFDMFGSWVKFILKTVLGDFSIPVSVKGSPREVEAFARAIQGEKRYIDAIGRYGLNNKATYNSRAQLASSIKGFERETGLSWPFN